MYELNNHTSQTRERRRRRVTGPSPKTSCVNLLWGSGGGLLSSASRSARAGRPLGDSGAGHPLGGIQVGHWARRGGDDDCDVALQCAVSHWVVGGVVAPALPHDAAPGASDGADRAGVFVAAPSGLGVEVLGPGVPVAA
jgi:hypothetical protein